MIGFGRAPCDDGVIRGAATAAGCADRAKPWVLAATILGSSMAFVDGSVVNVALPAIETDLGASLGGVQWVVNGYMLMLGALILVGGAAGDRFGRRRVFALGVVVFAAASVACGVVPDVVSLIAARAVQGIGGALLVPGSLAIISAAFPESERGRAIGTWAGFSALTTALGPVLGGWLVDAVSWRAIFFINVPVALATLVLTVRHVPESRDERGDAAIDWRGGALATAALAGLAYGFTAAAKAGWADPTVLGALLAGAALLALFVWAEARALAPMVSLDLFRSRTFSGANAMTLLLYAALGGALFFLPFNLISIQGYSATLAGAAFLPFTIIMGGLSPWSGGLIDRYGARRPLIVGPIMAAAGYALFALPGIGGSYWATFFPPMVVLGLGMAVSVAPLTTTVMSSVEERRAGAASGINNAASRIAGLLAVALFGAVAAGVFGAALETRLAPLHLSPAIARAVREEAPKLAEATPPLQATDAQRRALDRALHQSFVASFRVVMLMSAGLALSSALCAGLTIRAAGKNAAGPRRPSAC